MAGLSTTFHHPYVFKPPSSTHLLTASLRVRSLSGTVRLPSVFGANTISARYGVGGGGGGSSSPRLVFQSDSVMLVDQQQKMVGVVSKARAIQMNDDAELDLVILSPDADPLVVRSRKDHGFQVEVHLCVAL